MSEFPNAARRALLTSLTVLQWPRRPLPDGAVSSSVVARRQLVSRPAIPYTQARASWEPMSPPGHHCNYGHRSSAGVDVLLTPYAPVDAIHLPSALRSTPHR